ncbi:MULTISPECIES: NAD(P)(+) transhydrogenase (Re/Si-specific) subunit beta [Stenotrophomonas]|jgi:NAD(P) transhydrogenase subunit beta|uniref:NAD(P) transhydrogenase subunit beta n=1 Tax=Stenotrophomonas acidaminiphila TaxID=128780 RepID=A0A0R0DTZ4_9GAMM|nr:MULTISPECIES: NAD(P)(+) transhydrogenase (Re/Si-specific) subunit beta [Stenotrophomonas]OZB51660.1 MAG: NAD(P) transhydrogenase subunit beta [Stenotrophomonas sp. 14-69-23]ALJ27245.1 NAD(P) transhydrogenase subunit beta PntB [Stenotrophomonas acidaminiphila]KRG85152.1 NAD(P) transhydrogenase subunit beta [Stenotrophomonas acidaminiphila]QOF99227.1 NAD(P)(+) transhydrogenase (Re/Si-specific) subunit beta [Stenotrophomonas sp. CW117]WHL19529.1 NAD(P)(+) transhydrogenase (Re/Si-specific) subu
MSMTLLVKASYLVAATLFLLGLQRMASPRTARSGIHWAGAGMLIATVATFFLPGLHNIALILVALALGTGLAWVSAKKVAITDMPQMVALYNGMGGGSAAAIGAVELLRFADVAGRDTSHWSAEAIAALAARQPSTTVLALAVIGSAIGAVSLSGSVIAWAKLDGRLDKRVTFPGQQVFNLLVAVAMVALGVWAALSLQPLAIIAFFVAALALGVLMTLPIGGADMPVVISLYNAFTGLAVSFEGYVLGNEALIIAGMMVGAAGILLTRLMAKAMNRPISGVLFSHFGGGGQGAAEISGSQKPIEAADVAAMMAFAERVVIVPGYGMAVAQAQHKIWELAQRLIERGVKVKFAIHPVAGRMPGHMNVLLAEAGVPYDLIADMDDINPEFATTDVSLVIGANDVVNPVAKTDPSSPIYGMPILDVVNSRNTIVIKRGKGTGFAGIENALFYADNTRMLYGDGAEAASALVSELKALDGGH